MQLKEQRRFLRIHFEAELHELVQEQVTEAERFLELLRIIDVRLKKGIVRIHRENPLQ